MTAYRYRKYITDYGMTVFFPHNQRYFVRRSAPWWKFWILRKFQVVQNWDWSHPFRGFTKSQATKFVADLHSRGN